MADRKLKDNKCYYPDCKETLLFPMKTCVTCGIDHWCPSMCFYHFRDHIANYIKCPTVTYHQGRFVDKNCEDIIHDKHAIEYYPRGASIVYLWTTDDYVLRYHLRLGQISKGKLLLESNVFLQSDEPINLDKFRAKK